MGIDSGVSMPYRAVRLPGQPSAIIVSPSTNSISPENAPRQEDAFSAELAAMRLLHEISTQFTREGNTKALFRRIVSAALEITGAHLGNIQVVDCQSGKLRLMACCTQGMPLPDCCRQPDKEHTACGIALRQGERLVIEDIAEPPFRVGSASLTALQAAGVRSIQSLPLFTRAGRQVGILSIHGRQPRKTSESEQRLLDMLARQIADMIECSEATEALRQSQERHRCLFENMLDAYCHGRMIFHDRIPVDFECLTVNPAFEKLTGLQNVVGRRISDIVPGIRQDNPELFLVCGEVVQTGKPARFETYLASFGIWLAVAVYRPAKGEFVSVFDDITERKRLEMELHKRRSEMETLVKHQVAAHTAAAIAHELNQPLVAISAYSEVALRLLRHGDAQSDKLTRALEGSFEQAQRAGRTLHELLDFLHNGETLAAPLNLNETVREAVALVKGNSHGLFQPLLELAPALPPILGNRIQIQKVLENLLRNGIEAMEQARMPDKTAAMAIRTATVDGMARITVQDSGPGIDAHGRKRLFDPFFSTKPTGIGLGLVISRTLVEAHGGRLWLDQEAGPGACFHFTLPFAS